MKGDASGEGRLSARDGPGTERTDDRPPETTVVPSDRFVDAAYRVFRKHFERMKKNEPGTRLGEDPECLHDMRVAARRLRAAIRTFGPAFPDRVLASHAKNLRRIVRTLGDVRDLDVYLAHLPDYASVLAGEGKDALLPFKDFLEVRRTKARRRMLRYLDTRGYIEFLARFERFLGRGPPKRPRRPMAGLPVTEAAAQRIEAALRKVRKVGRGIPRKHPPPEELHRLRIRVKRLRYTCEFFSDLSGTQMKRFVKATVALQDFLGAHQDACVAGDFLESFAKSLPREEQETSRTAAALRCLVSAQQRAAARARKRFARAFERFDRKKVRPGLLGAE